MKFDYYKILGLERNANISDIKRAYRKLAMQFHPDRNPGDNLSEERFKLVTEAYEVLKDANRRLEYDRIMASKVAEQAQRSSSFQDDFFIPADEMLGDFMRGFYSRNGDDKKSGRRGRDLRHNLKISFEEAALGVETEIKIPSSTQCPQCNGTGMKAGAKAIICTGCRGKGKVRNNKGLLTVCHICNGSGAVISGFCKRCNGSGKVRCRHSILVHVPPGVEAGTRLQVKNMGGPGSSGGKPGDLFVVIHVKKHPFFYREDFNVICNVPVPIFKAIPGCSLEIPTLEGKRKVKVPAGAQTGMEIRLSGLGIRSQQKKKRGDLIIRLHIEIPKKFSIKEKRILKTLEENIKIEKYPLTLRYIKNLKMF